jgi:hypothetical protein
MFLVRPIHKFFHKNHFYKMKHLYSRVFMRTLLIALAWLVSTLGIKAQNFRAYSTPVCPGQTEVYTVGKIPAGYRLNAPSAAGGGALSNIPAIDTNNGTATFQVRWRN